jgi:hypothetical protein
MPRSSASTPQKRAKLRELRAQGIGLRPAAKAVGISHETARSWEKADAAKPARRKPSPRGTTTAGRTPRF